jgi:hypothetical protein
MSTMVSSIVSQVTANLTSHSDSAAQALRTDLMSFQSSMETYVATHASLAAHDMSVLREEVAATTDTHSRQLEDITFATADHADRLAELARASDQSQADLQHILSRINAVELRQLAPPVPPHPKLLADAPTKIIQYC